IRVDTPNFPCSAIVPDAESTPYFRKLTPIHHPGSNVGSRTKDQPLSLDFNGQPRHEMLTTAIVFIRANPPLGTV
ncbi:hypothetical protein K0M31_020154, partial [Melipona bicolor]